ncbi:MAG: hypothetical protein ACREKL_17220, partial [Chthoniobacterales bacterium]
MIPSLLRSLALASGAFALTLVPSAFAGSAAPTTDVTVKEESALTEWWHGKYASGTWFGMRDTLA